ncbi:MAG: phosphate acyltransferase PlsX [Rickettsiales bacterium]|jgi:phosphate acyltransferase|nr:phosphate acyltransferase PlsX [Rickettsiales bacterium]
MGSSQAIIAIDVMGGDNAPDAVILGADFFLKKNKDVNFLLFGDEDKFQHLLDKTKYLKNYSTVIDCKKVISSEDNITVALKNSRDTSMRLAIESVKDKKADAVISSGNTGALMALSKICYKTLDGIDRPAIASVVPTKLGNPSVLLDMGANSHCDANNIWQFAVMGDAYAKVILANESPSMGLLNIGSEDMKGNEVVRVANQLLQESDFLNYQGYVEGNDIVSGKVDIIITDGFTGNIALKAIEGTAVMCKHYLKKGFKSSPLSMLGFLFSYLSLKKVFSNLDPRNYNGGMFLGLNGITIKSHGCSDARGFANAIKVARKLVINNINDKIIDELNQTSFKD